MVGKLTRFAVLPLLLLALVAIGGANGQPPLPGEPPTIKSPAVEVPLRAAPPAEAPTVEQLVAKLEGLRKQKADIEVQEKAIIEQLKKTHKQLEELLSKLGVIPPPMVERPLDIFPGSAPAKPK